MKGTRGEREAFRIVEGARRDRDRGRDGAERAGEPGFDAALGGRYRIGGAIRDGVEPPDEHEPDLVIRGRVHWFYGTADAGKTWLALWLIARAIKRGERVVFFDTENGARDVAESLALLGVDPDAADELLRYYPFPLLDAESEAAYRQMLEDFAPALIVFDSLANFLGAAGLDESTIDDLIRWAAAYTRPARASGITVVLLDHSGHDDTRPRGASRKVQEADVLWSVRCPQPFDRDTVGSITIRRQKDRSAWLPDRVKFSVGGGASGFVFRQSYGTVQQPDQSGLTKRDRAVLGVLVDEFGPEGATAGAWQKACRKPPLSMAVATFYRSLRALKEGGKVTITEGGRDSAGDSRYTPAKPDPTPGDYQGGDSRESRQGKPDSGYYQSRDSSMIVRGDSSGQPDYYHSLSPPLI